MDSTTFAAQLLHVQKAISCAPSVEERAALSTSLMVLKKNYKFDTVQFLGKVFGISSDYLLAQGYEGNQVFNRKTFCSSDGSKWVQLPAVTQQTIALCALIHGRFSGVLSTAFTVDAEEEEEEEAGSVSERSSTTKVTVTEEQRLAAAVAMLDHDTSAVPRGAYRLSATGEVIKNSSYSGLPVALATELPSYLHLRTPEVASKRTLLEQESVDKFIDFLDPVVDDVPKNCWSLQKDGASGLVVLRSLRWPGFVSFVVPGTAEYGYAYFGTGERNDDIAFQL